MTDRTDDHHSIDSIVDHIRALPRSDQLRVLQTLAVAIIPDLEDDERSAFIENLNVAVSRALQRPGSPAGR